MRFTKMHGIANDYVVLGFETGEDRPWADWSRVLCDRRNGVGADGMLAVLPSDKADFRMRIFNNDGSEAEMCGNGIRCATKFFVDTKRPEWKSYAAHDVSVETQAGPRSVLIRFEGGEVGMMTVNMGRPILDPARVPVDVPGGKVVRHPLDIDGRIFEITCVSMGNPHAVIFLDEDVTHMDIETLGSRIEKHPLFPRRTNVEFINVLGPGEMRMRVWERGVGETPACGTGACATLVAAVLNGLTDRSAVIHLPGGDLRVAWEEDDTVLMTGPAATVFEGDWTLPL